MKYPKKSIKMAPKHDLLLIRESPYIDRIEVSLYHFSPSNSNGNDRLIKIKIEMEIYKIKKKFPTRIMLSLRGEISIRRHCIH